MITKKTGQLLSGLFVIRKLPVGDYAKNVLSNVVGGMAGNRMSKGMFGVAGAPVAREITNLGVSTGVGTLVNKMVDMLCGDK